MPHTKPNNREYQVVGKGGVPYPVQIDIDAAAWNACIDDQVQVGVINILNNQPIQLLAKGDHGPGIKQENKGLEFHTQTDDRLQCPNGNLTKDKTFHFTQCKKGWGH